MEATRQLAPSLPMSSRIVFIEEPDEIAYHPSLMELAAKSIRDHGHGLRNPIPFSMWIWRFAKFSQYVYDRDTTTYWLLLQHEIDLEILLYLKPGLVSDTSWLDNSIRWSICTNAKQAYTSLLSLLLKDREPYNTLNILARFLRIGASLNKMEFTEHIVSLPLFENNSARRIMKGLLQPYLKHGDSTRAKFYIQCEFHMNISFKTWMKYLEDDRNWDLCHKSFVLLLVDKPTKEDIPPWTSPKHFEDVTYAHLASCAMFHVAVDKDGLLEIFNGRYNVRYWMKDLLGEMLIIGERPYSEKMCYQFKQIMQAWSVSHDSVAGYMRYKGIRGGDIKRRFKEIHSFRSDDTYVYSNTYVITDDERIAHKNRRLRILD